MKGAPDSYSMEAAVEATPASVVKSLQCKGHFSITLLSASVHPQASKALADVVSSLDLPGKSAYGMLNVLTPVDAVASERVYSSGVIRTEGATINNDSSGSGGGAGSCAVHWEHDASSSSGSTGADIGTHRTRPGTTGAA